MKNETMIEMAKILTDCYVKLNALHAQPGDKCHMLANSIKFMERMMKPLYEPPMVFSDPKKINYVGHSDAK